MPQIIRADTHTGITAEHERKLRRHGAAPSGGVSGLAAYSMVVPQTITVGSSYTFSANWTQQSTLGNHGTSLVSGQPHYSAGFYISQLFLQVDFPSDGHDHEFRLVALSEYMLGGTQFVTAGNYAWSHTFSGCFYTTSDTATGVFVKYLQEPPGASTSMTATRFWHTITRLGDVPA